MSILPLESAVCAMQCELTPQGVLRIKGAMKVGGKATVYAANPISRGISYMGSAMPYASREQAMACTPNVYDVPEGQAEFAVDFWYPNAFSTEDRRGLVPPTIFVKVNGTEVAHKLPHPFSLRTLTHRPERTQMGPSFYAKRAELGVRSQESILRALSEPTPYLY